MMSFWDHLDVLRRALFRVIGVYVALFAVALWLTPKVFSTFILGPTTEDFFVYQLLERLSSGAFSAAGNLEVQIININVASQFLTHINTAMIGAAIVAFPYVVYELWLFVKPALYSGELRGVRGAFAGGTVMFFLGCLTGYAIVFPLTFRFLAQYELSTEIVNQISLQSYISTFAGMILVMGLVFEMPVVAWLLSVLGLLRKAFLRQYRRHAVVVLLVLAAFITPSGDPFTLLVVFLPLYLLYELSIVVVKA